MDDRSPSPLQPSMPPADRSQHPFVAGIILAAGASARMGRPKQLLPLAGRPLLQHVVDAAAASSLDEIILVLGHNAAEIRAALVCPDRVRIIVGTDHTAGQSASLRAGVHAASPAATAVAILLGDQPGISARLIDTVVAAFGTAPAPVVRPVYCTQDGRRVPGHPVILARRIWPEVEALRGDQGARFLLTAHPEWLREVRIAGDAPRDVDTWDDYQQTIGARPPSAT
jgi:molybdenum cofactor cytidylyltransferase